MYSEVELYIFVLPSQGVHLCTPSLRSTFLYSQVKEYIFYSEVEEYTFVPQVKEYIYVLPGQGIHFLPRVRLCTPK